MPKREKPVTTHVTKKRYGDNPKRDNIKDDPERDRGGTGDSTGGEGLAEDELLDGGHPYRGADKDGEDLC
jgi:hypothetical protein